MTIMWLRWPKNDYIHVIILFVYRQWIQTDLCRTRIFGWLKQLSSDLTIPTVWYFLNEKLYMQFLFTSWSFMIHCLLTIDRRVTNTFWMRHLCNTRWVQGLISLDIVHVVWFVVHVLHEILRCTYWIFRGCL